MVAPVVAAAGIAGGSMLGSALLSKPSQSESGMDIGQKEFVKQQNWWTRKRQARNIKDRSQQMLDNQMLGGKSLLDIAKGGIRPRSDVINQGYGNAASRLQGGLMAGQTALSGGTPDYSYMGPRDINPDFSYLEDVEMPAFDTKRIKEWQPPKEDVKKQERLLESGGKMSSQIDNSKGIKNLAKYGAEG